MHRKEIKGQRVEGKGKVFQREKGDMEKNLRGKDCEGPRKPDKGLSDRGVGFV